MRKRGALASQAVMKDSGRLIARRFAVRLLTGSAGRFAAFVIDVSVASAVYWSRRLTGKETPW
jgi:hypothetical protein